MGLKLKNIIIVMALFISAFRFQVQSYDVVIVGAGSGGVSAAIQASRMGSSVLLLEETDYVGGQMTTSGVTSMDGNYNYKYGIYKEFINKIIAYYSGNVSGCYFSQ